MLPLARTQTLYLNHSAFSLLDFSLRSSTPLHYSLLDSFTLLSSTQFHLTSLYAALLFFFSCSLFNNSPVRAIYCTLISSLLLRTVSCCLFGCACFPCSAQFPLICGLAFGFDHSHNERQRLDPLMPL